MTILIIVGGSDPLYEINFDAGRERNTSRSYLHQFIAHASLDVIDNLMWVNDSCFLRVVDKFDTTVISAYASVGGHYLLLLHEGKEEDQVLHFFKAVHDILGRYLVNPFVEPDASITSKDFDTQIRACGKKIFSF